MEYIQYIKPELLILIPVLIFFGRFLKTAEFVKDKHIPLILGTDGILLACLWVIGQGYDNIFNAILTGIIQGILCAGAAVYGNQVFKQYRKDE